MILVQMCRRGGLVLALIFGFCGCTSASRVPLSAADSMDLLAVSLGRAIDEYGLDLEKLDEQRRKAVVDAFVVRVRTDPFDDEALAGHATTFTAALERIDADRRAASDRRQAAIDNLETLREIAEGLRRVALESMSLDDEARRYFTGVISQIHASQVQTSGVPNDFRP